MYFSYLYIHAFHLFIYLFIYLFIQSYILQVFQERSGVVAGVRVYLKTTDGPPTLVIPGKPLINNDFRVTRTIAYYETFEDIYKPYDKWLH